MTAGSLSTRSYKGGKSSLLAGRMSSLDDSILGTGGNSLHGSLERPGDRQNNITGCIEQQKPFCRLGTLEGAS